MGGRGSSGRSSGGGGGAKGLKFVTKMDYAVPGMGTITAYTRSGAEAGHITFGNGKVHGINVEPAHQRQGIGTELFRRASKAVGGGLSHSANRTDAGDAFAKKVGGKTPPRSDWRP